MNLEINGEGRAVHYPANPDRFEFDQEVSAIFPTMAERSIPNYREAHAAHARMLARWIKPGVTILDVGASRGAFIAQLREEYSTQWIAGDMEIDAIDNSPDMCAYLRGDFPSVHTECLDLESAQFLSHPQKQYDVVCVNYVLQFVDPRYQIQVLRTLANMVKVGGVFILGHKAKHYGFAGDVAHEEYVRFRMQNGYTREEINAKTRALRGSMFPMDHSVLMRELKTNFSEVEETFRYMQFSTLFAVK